MTTIVRSKEHLKRKFCELKWTNIIKLLSELDLKTYNLHLKLSNYLGAHIWENLEQNKFDFITFHAYKKIQNLGEKFINLQKPKPLETLSNQNQNNVVN